MNDKPTWRPPEPGPLDDPKADVKALPDTAFAFARRRKQPMTNAGEVMAAIDQFASVKDVMADDREVAFANIQVAARYYGIDLKDRNWYELFRRVQAGDARASGASNEKK